MWIPFTLLRKLSAPPYRPPPPLDEDAAAEFTLFRPFGKCLNVVHWRPTPLCAGAVEALILGDSYADDIDMGFYAWPSKLAQLRSLACLNAARGGAESRHVEFQYKHAKQFAQSHNLKLDGGTVCVVHAGGNDLLHGLWLGPLAALAIYADIIAQLMAKLGLTRPITELPRFSFFGVATRQTGRRLGGLVQLLIENGHTRILISGSPVCSQVPTARFVVSLLLGAWIWPGGRDLVAHLIDAVAKVAQQQVFAFVQAASEAACLATGRPSGSVEIVYFDEAAALRTINAAAGARPCWRDGHHPAEWVHAELAHAANRQLNATSRARSVAREGAARAPLEPRETGGARRRRYSKIDTPPPGGGDGDAQQLCDQEARRSCAIQ